MKQGTPLESFAQYVYSTLLDLDGQDVLVSRDVAIKDSRGRLQRIDVYYEFDHLSGTELPTRFRVAIECKDWSKAVSKGAVQEFSRKLQDIPNVAGVVISANGYQSGAKEVAQDDGIVLLTTKDLPSFASLVARQLQKLCLPDEYAIGEPFWALMEQSSGNEVTGSYHCVEDGDKMLFPLYLTKSLAEQYLSTPLGNGGSTNCVRGISRRQLSFMLDITEKQMPGKSTFGIIFAMPDKDGSAAMVCLSHAEFKETYCGKR